MRLLVQFAIGALLIDQISKYLVVFRMGLEHVLAIDVLPPFLNFRYGENRGVNFGLLTGETDWARWALIGLSLIVAASVLYWVRRWHAQTWQMQASAGLVVGGALGNVSDRLIHGYVLDFLNMSCCGLNNPFVFNVADIFIFTGLAGLVLFDGGLSRKNAA